METISFLSCNVKLPNESGMSGAFEARLLLVGVGSLDLELSFVGEEVGSLDVLAFPVGVVCVLVVGVAC